MNPAGKPVRLWRLSRPGRGFHSAAPGLDGRRFNRRRLTASGLAGCSTGSANPPAISAPGLLDGNLDQGSRRHNAFRPGHQSYQADLHRLCRPFVGGNQKLRRFDGGVGRHRLDARAVEKRQCAVDHGVGRPALHDAPDVALLGAEESVTRHLFPSVSARAVCWLPARSAMSEPSARLPC